jgi:hypothetical protein
VGTAVPVTVTGYTLSGTDAANYSVIQPAPVSANITQALLDVTGITANNKVYDALTDATLAGTATVAPLLTDVVTVSGTGVGVFSTKNVGTAVPVTVTGYTLSGTDAANYSVVQPAPVSANITQALLDVTGITANNKVYDALTDATLAGTATVAPLLTDSVMVSGPGVGVFSTKNVGTAVPVTVTGYTLSGTDAANYSVVQPAPVSANITQAPGAGIIAMTQFELNILRNEPGSLIEVLSLMPTIVVLENYDPVGFAIDDDFSLKSGNGAAINTMMSTGRRSPVLRVINGGFIATHLVYLGEQ